MKIIFRLGLIGLVFLFFLFFSVQIGVIKLGVSFPCACVHKDEIIRWRIHDVEEIIKSEKKLTGLYPNFKTVSEKIDKKHFSGIGFYKDDLLLIRKEGIYYKTTEDGHSYVIEGYAKNDLGITVKVDYL